MESPHKPQNQHVCVCVLCVCVCVCVCVVRVESICYYHGQIRGNDNSRAALSTCNGLQWVQERIHPLNA